MNGAMFSNNVGGGGRIYGRKNANIRVGALAVEKFNTHGGAPSVPLTAGGVYRVEVIPASAPTTTATVKMGEGGSTAAPADPNGAATNNYWDFLHGNYEFVALEGQRSIQVTFSGAVASRLVQLS